MHFEKFINDVSNNISCTLGPDVRVNVQKVIKTNDVELHGLTIIDEGVNISPTIYLNDFFLRYEYSQMTFDEIIKKILDIYKHNKAQSNIDISFYTDFNKVKNRIAYKLINTKQNQKLLESTPSVKFLDLSIVFYYHFASKNCDNASILIKKEHLKMWNIDINTLFSLAKTNTPKLFPHTLRNMLDILKGSGFDMIEHELPDENAMPMYVLSNVNGIFGSCSILYDGVLKEFADKIKSNLYILPSSTHEIILVPTDDDNDIESFSNMVREVNKQEVSEEEFLSDHAYFYNRKEDKIELGGNC